MKPAFAPALGVNLVWLSQVDSTNAAAARLIASWAEDEDARLADTVIVAATQTAGKGRNAHVWQSPIGGLYATWIGWLTATDLGWLPIAGGVGLAAAVQDTVPSAEVRLKWPNDLLVNGMKLGGLLCQSRTRGDAVWAAVGFGVNVDVAPPLPEGNATGAISLAALGVAPGDFDLGWRIVRGFAGRLRGLLQGERSALRAAWLAHAVHRRGDPIRLRSGDEVVAGAYVGITPDACLELDVAGARRVFAAGDLIGPIHGTEG